MYLLGHIDPLIPPSITSTSRPHILCAHVIILFPVVISPTVISVTIPRRRTTLHHSPIAVIVFHRATAYRSSPFIEQWCWPGAVVLLVTSLRCAAHYLSINGTAVLRIAIAITITIVVRGAALVRAQHGPVMYESIRGSVLLVNDALAQDLQGE